MAATGAGVARFSFVDLCQKALGAADYLVIGQSFHTVFVSDIPVLTIHELNWLRRFITFVDSMYECKVKLLLHAQTVPVTDILQTSSNEEGQHYDEVFAFDRTVSRLQEMASDSYLRRQAWKGQSSSSSGTTSTSSSTVHVVPTWSA